MVSEGDPVGVLEGLPGALGAIRQAVGDTELPPFFTLPAHCEAAAVVELYAPSEFIQLCNI